MAYNKGIIMAAGTAIIGKIVAGPKWVIIL